MREAVVDIVRIKDGDTMTNRLAACLSSSVVEYPAQWDPEFVELDHKLMPKLDSCVNVEAYGNRLWDALCNHEAIKAELRQLSLTQPPDKALLHFLIKTPEAERLRWETLRVTPPPGFLALNGVCAVSRIAYSGNPLGPHPLTFSFPLRMAAFLSPAGVDAKPEFDAICERIATSRAKGLDIECTVFLGDQDLLDSAQSDIDAGKLPGIRLAGMPSDSLGVEEKIKDSAAQILHFFCHGKVEAGVKLLEFATIRDRELDRKTGSVTLSIERLNQTLLTTRATWITVLNSCSGAQAVDQLHSMAHDLAKRASPFAVGMAEPIDPRDATDFARAFYGKLFEIVNEGVSGLELKGSATLDLTPTVSPARDVLHGRYQREPPDAFGRWCLPILYQRYAPEGPLNAPLKVVLMPPEVPPGIKLRIDLVAEALRALPSDAPDGLRDAILAALDREPAVPKNLRPDRLGKVGLA